MQPLTYTPKIRIYLYNKVNPTKKLKRRVQRAEEDGRKDNQTNKVTAELRMTLPEHNRTSKEVRFHLFGF